MNKNPNTKNLKPFKKGQTGNPKGRPKLPDLKEAIAKVLGEEKDGNSALEAILKAQRLKAAKGDTRAAEFLLDRGYGKAKQVIEDAAGEKLTIEIVNIKRDDENEIKK